MSDSDHSPDSHHSQPALNEDFLQRCEEKIGELAGSTVTVAQVRALDRDFGQPWATMIASSAENQKKAITKLGDGLWWTTDKAIQQATPHQVSRFKTGWFQANELVLDLCCGIGGDAAHLARRGPVCAVDMDPNVCHMVTRNLHNSGIPADSIDVVCGNVVGIEIQDSWFHLDPDRRTQKTRASDPDFYSPDWEQVLSIIIKARGGVVKLAPAAEPAELPEICHRAWISLGGTVREQSLIVGELVRRLETVTDADQRSAIAITNDGQAFQFCCVAGLPHNEVAKPLRWIVDPDAAIRAAGLTTSFANRFQLSCLGGPSGFLTGDENHDLMHGLGRCEEVLWCGSADNRKLRREFRSRNCFPQSVKTRGVSIDPNQLAKQLRSCGEAPVTLWIGRSGKSHFAAITRLSE